MKVEIRRLGNKSRYYLLVSFLFMCLFGCDWSVSPPHVCSIRPK